MSKAISTTACADVAYGESKGLSMSPERADRFAAAMWRISKAIHSLQVAARTFPNFGPSDDCMEPATTVDVFSQAMDRDVQLIFQMMEVEEQPEVSQ